jgi:murein L,D-transpeptidase YafK
MPRLLSLIAFLCILLCSAVVARADGIVGFPDDARTAEAGDADPPSELENQLTAAGFRLGAPAFLRVFKAESTLEVWLLRNGRFDLYRRYSICKWSGVLGPKLREGDRQSPEGVYFITGGDLIVNRRWHRAMNVGFPNTRDRALGLSGSGILIHGKCRSVGCFALTDGVVEDVYDIVQVALEAGQPRVPVHIFPFALTREKLNDAGDGRWSDFWLQLKRGYDLFMRDRLPPRTMVCNGRYAFQSRREPLVSLAGNPACTELTRPAHPMLAAAMHAVSFRDALGLGRAEAPPAPRACGPRNRHCHLVKAAATSISCPRKYRRCHNAHVAAVKSVDCPLKYPRCRKQGVSLRSANATVKSKRKVR